MSLFIQNTDPLTLRMERVYQTVVEKTSKIMQEEKDNVDCYPKMRGLMEDLTHQDLELLETKMRDELFENDRVLIKHGVYKEKELATENVNPFKKWNHNCIRLGRLFSMHYYTVNNEEKNALLNAIVKDSMFLNPIVAKKIL